MNKKFSTLMAIALLAGGVNAYGQVGLYQTTSDAARLTNETTASTVYKALADGKAAFNYFVKDQATWFGSNASDFPKVSPFPISVENGARPITELESIDGKTDSRYFQIVVGATGALNNTYALSDQARKEVLTMVYVTTDEDGNKLPADKCHYELAIENVNNANVNKNPIYLDRTLWEVRVERAAGAGTVLYYTLINKASNQSIKFSTAADNVIGSEFTVGTNKYKEIGMDIVAGQSQWRWADGQKSNDGVGPLRNYLRAQYSNQETVYLMSRTETSISDPTDIKNNTKVSLAALVANSNDVTPTTGTITTGNVTYTPLVFEAWEANPVILNANQLNTEIGYENIREEGQGDRNALQFYFNPDVAGMGAVNVMIDKNFKAVDAESDGTTKVPGDIPDGFVRFNKKGSSEYLMVDTTYHFDGIADRYDLQMAVREINPARFAIVADNKTVADVNSAIANKSIYTAAGYEYTAKSYVQMLRQSNFRAILYPSTNSVRLQAEMMFKADKAKLSMDKANYSPWWEQAADYASTTTGQLSQVGSALTNDVLYVAPYAANPALNPYSETTPGSQVVNAVGYYPAYAQAISAAQVISQGQRVLSYANQFTSASNNGYHKYGKAVGANNYWNAVGNIASASDRADESNVVAYFGLATSSPQENLTVDPASIVSGASDAIIVYSPNYALAHNNVVKLVKLTADHRELTADLYDVQDAKELTNGLLTLITINNLKPVTNELAHIDNGYYYMVNANMVRTDLREPGAYRMEDLAATNATFTYWNALTSEWDVAVVDSAYNNYTTRMYPASWKDAEKGNIVYSDEKVEIPSAQWFIEGNDGYYTIYNRESGRKWGTSYWWEVPGQDGVYVNMATYTDGTGISTQYRDTVRLEKVSEAILKDPDLGYKKLTKEEVLSDTTTFEFSYNTVGDIKLLLGQGEGVDSLLQIMKEPENQGKFKFERVLFTDKDLYSSATYKTTDMKFGINPAINGQKKDYGLVRALYYIYKDDVSANTGVEGSSIRTREYIALDAGKYRLTKVTVKTSDDQDYTTLADQAIIAGTKVDNRVAFYVKQITNDNDYVLVDPFTVAREDINNGISYYGVRAFANQLTGTVQPSGLVSEGASNAFANSVFRVETLQAYNYADIRPAGVARDTVEFYSAKTDGQYLLSENCNVAGAHVGLMESLDKLMNKNNAMFIDTANVAYPECPKFLIGLRSNDVEEESNLDDHNRHLYTDADYLINMVDSATTNKAYVYQNQPFNSTKYYRLGFMSARHYGDVRPGEDGKPSLLKFMKSGKEFELDKLGKTELNIATFAFRYPNASRNLEDGVYIETMYDKTTRGWLKTINHILVVTPKIQEADLFKVNYDVETTPTANEEIAASSVVVAGTNGAVVVKGAEGKNVIVSTILGKVVANEVVSSDNATIAAPQGVVVVSVDGESFKVVVK